MQSGEEERKKSDRTKQKEKEINCKKKQLKVQRKEPNSCFQMAHVIMWQQQQQQQQRGGVHDVSWTQTLMKKQ